MPILLFHFLDIFVNRMSDQQSPSKPQLVTEQDKGCVDNSIEQEEEDDDKQEMMMSVDETPAFATSSPIHTNRRQTRYTILPEEYSVIVDINGCNPDEAFSEVCT